MPSLDDVIDSSASLEIKRALAVKMILSDFKTKNICTLLNVSDAFVSKWKIIYENAGVAGLRLNYKSGTGFLTEYQRYEILFYLRNKPNYSVEELRDYMERHYGVVYQSKQSYYDLLHQAGLSWQRTQAVNPRRDDAQVQQKRQEIKKLEARPAAIGAGALNFPDSFSATSSNPI